MPVTGLENFNLTHTSFRRFGARRCTASVYLQTFDVTSAVRNIPISKRFAYVASRADRWIKSLYRVYPTVSFEPKHPRLPVSNAKRWSQLPSTLVVRASARELLSLADAAGVSSIYVTRVAGIRRRRLRKQRLSWYCVRAFVVIRVEGAKSGMQDTEDRFMLVRARSFEDAEKRIGRQWRDYASLYLNPNGQIVSWSLEKVIDVYDTGETEIDSAGTEVYSKLAQRRMRPENVWHPRS